MYNEKMSNPRISNRKMSTPRISNRKMSTPRMSNNLFNLQVLELTSDRVKRTGPDRLLIGIKRDLHVINFSKWNLLQTRKVVRVYYRMEADTL